MEGGIESNEDYTYVRGRGRGRYVCESCGIRCKKPSMLRKHLRTHTDLRPYTCKLCNFSFKTKGNLTKHHNSKSHLKKCAGLGIDPESDRSLAFTGPEAFSISDGTSTTDEKESDDDIDVLDEATDSQEEVEDDDVNMTGSMTGAGNEESGGLNEIAQSLLDLRKATFLPRIVSPGNMASGSDPFNSAVAEAPIDLSVKPSTSRNLVTHQKLQAFDEHNAAKRIKLEETGDGGGAGVRLHQPWLSPSELMVKKVEPSEVLCSISAPASSSTSTQSSVAAKPSIEIRPLRISPIPVLVDVQRPQAEFRQPSRSQAFVK